MAELSAACEGKAGTQFEHRLPDPSLETGSFGALVYLPAGYWHYVQSPHATLGVNFWWWPRGWLELARLGPLGLVTKRALGGSQSGRRAGRKAGVAQVTKRAFGRTQGGRSAAIST